MYQKSAVPCEQLFSSAGYIVNKTHSSLEPNTVNYTRLLAVVCHPMRFEQKNV